MVSRVFNCLGNVHIAFCYFKISNLNSSVSKTSLHISDVLYRFLIYLCRCILVSAHWKVYILKQPIAFSYWKCGQEKLHFISFLKREYRLIFFRLLMIISSVWPVLELVCSFSQQLSLSTPPIGRGEETAARLLVGYIPLYCLKIIKFC